MKKEFIEITTIKAWQLVVCNPGDLDDAKDVCIDVFGSFSHFTVGRGNAKYHFLTLARNSCGVYYASRLMPDGTAQIKRQLEPLQKICVHPEK